MDEESSAVGAFLSKKGLAWCGQGTTTESGNAAIRARTQHVMGLSLAPIHPGMGCLVWTVSHGLWSGTGSQAAVGRALPAVREAQRQGVPVPGTALGSGPTALAPGAPLAGLGWGLRLNHLDFLWDLRSVGLTGSGEVGGRRQVALHTRLSLRTRGWLQRRWQDEGWLGMEEPLPCLTWELLQGFG